MMFSEVFEIFLGFGRFLKGFLPYFSIFWQIFKSWWWLPLPFIFWRPFCFLWLWWRTDLWLKKQKFILLEIRIPKEVLKPIRAMETVMSALWQPIYDPPDWWEKWIEGKIQLSYSFEIVSIDGEPHFFIRIPEPLRDSIEAIIYSQYPQAEISVADDYTKKVPQDIPNKDWDLWGCDYRLLKEDPYPIKTYKEFETEREAIEEKRVDPIASLLEAFNKIKKGEQIWIQMVATPVTNKEVPWIKEGEEIKDKLAKREKKKVKRRPMILEAIDVLITGEPPSGPKKEEESVIPPEMKLTPGERETVAAIEKKISKSGFHTNIRFIYLGKKDAFFKPNLRLVFGFFASFKTEDLNALVPWGKTICKIHKSWFLPLNLLLPRRLYLRKRKIFRRYCLRVHPLFPKKAKFPARFVLNTEELASIYHFPGRASAPAPFVPRIESKKGEAPPTLPTE